MAVFTILGLAAGAQALVPWACSAGASICAQSEAEPELLLADDGAVAAEPSAPSSAEPAPVAVTEVAAADSPAASLGAAKASTAAEALAAVGSRNMDAQMPAPLAAQGDLIASTFASLGARPLNGLSQRVVRSVAIAPDGTVAGASAAASADASTEPEAAAEPVTPAAEAAEPAPVAVAAEPVAEESSSLAYAAGGGGDTATVAGAGANVRSKPQKGGSEVLFALRGGAEVTIVESSKGWMRVVDDRGRSGWIYGVYLRR